MFDGLPTIEVPPVQEEEKKTVDVSGICLQCH